MVVDYVNGIGYSRVDWVQFDEEKMGFGGYLNNNSSYSILV